MFCCKMQFVQFKGAFDNVWRANDFIYSLILPAVSPQSLRLKFGPVIIFRRNLDPQFFFSVSRLFVKHILSQAIGINILDSFETVQNLTEFLF